MGVNRGRHRDTFERLVLEKLIDLCGRPRGRMPPLKTFQPVAIEIANPRSYLPTRLEDSSFGKIALPIEWF